MGRTKGRSKVRRRPAWVVRREGRRLDRQRRDDPPSDPIMDRGRFRDVYRNQHAIAGVGEDRDAKRRKSQAPYAAAAIAVGVLVALLTYTICSASAWAVRSMAASMAGGSPMPGASTGMARQSKTGVEWVGGVGDQDSSWAPYVWEDVTSNGIRYGVTDAEGNHVGEATYESATDVPPPDWYLAALEEQRAAEAVATTEGTKAEGGTASAGVPATGLAAVVAGALAPTGLALTLGTLVGLVAGAAMWARMRRSFATQNQEFDLERRARQEYPNDAEIQGPLMMLESDYLDYVPDCGMHGAVDASSIVTHVCLQNKGVGKVGVVRRHKEDVLGEDGEVLYYAGEPVEDEDGEPVVDMLPMFDEQLQGEIFDAAGIGEQFIDAPEERKVVRSIRWPWDPTYIRYNPGGRRKGALPYDTLAEMIRAKWHLPEYEWARPAGAYIVTTEPVNTMVLAITRAGKGQFIINPTLDMWSRCDTLCNIICNDSKGELCRDFIVPFILRGLDVIQYNLMYARQSDKYNFLLYAAQDARDGNHERCVSNIESMAAVFFPITQGQEPVWSISARNVFKRLCYLLIDYYLEEETRLRRSMEGKSPITVEDKVDEMWGQVTPNAAYMMFIELTTKTVKSPMAMLEEDQERWLQEHEGASDAERKAREMELAKLRRSAEMREPFWGGKEEQDYLSLILAATKALPVSSMREQLNSTSEALNSMNGAQKMMSSVNAIALSEMRFFNDPKIQSLTSGRPSQNVDLEGLPYPRRFGVRLDPKFLSDKHLEGCLCRWTSWWDDSWEDEDGRDLLDKVDMSRGPRSKGAMGPAFEHQGTIDAAGWAWYVFRGCYPQEKAYVRLEIFNHANRVSKRMYFQFKKGHAMVAGGRTRKARPVTGGPVIQGGVLEELVPLDKRGKGFKRGHWMVHDEGIQVRTGDPRDDVRKAPVTRPAVRSWRVYYTERPKAIFFITPPNLRSYVKLMLILVSQTYDLHAGATYVTTKEQKPFYKTKYMLDELGNLHSEGNGIDELTTKLSIGLGQGQEFHIILQTMQQLRDVYGSTSDKTIQGNTRQIVFLASTDDTMINELSGMSGRIHRASPSSVSMTTDQERVVNRAEGHASTNFSFNLENVLGYNDFAFMDECNSIVLSARRWPVMSRNHFVMPYMYLFQNRAPKDPGNEYSMQNLPSNVDPYAPDAKSAVPDFVGMVARRVNEAAWAAEAERVYCEKMGIGPFDKARLDRDTYSANVMSLVEAYVDHDDPEFQRVFRAGMAQGRTDVDQEMAYQAAEAKAARLESRRIDGLDGWSLAELRRDSLSGSTYTDAFDAELGEAYGRCWTVFQESSPVFDRGAGRSLVLVDEEAGDQVLVQARPQSQMVAEAAKATGSTPALVRGELDGEAWSYQVSHEFVDYLVDHWRQVPDTFKQCLKQAIERGGD